MVRRRELNTLRNYSNQYHEERMGLCFSYGWLVYGHNHGALRLIPRWAKRAIVLAWNRVVCAIKGHDDTEAQIAADSESGWPSERIPCCCHCSTPITAKRR
jgi:hypothetical protein